VISGIGKGVIGMCPNTRRSREGLEGEEGRKIGDEMRTRLIADIHSFVYGPVAEDYWT